MPETLAVDDRAGFYEETGAYRDMVVTHLFHVLGFVAMEPPTALDGRSIVEETGKVFRSVKPISPNCVIRGQYAGYREGKGVNPDSQTETFIAHARRDRQLALVAACRSSCAPASGWASRGGC